MSFLGLLTDLAFLRVGPVLFSITTRCGLTKVESTGYSTNTPKSAENQIPPHQSSTASWHNQAPHPRKGHSQTLLKILHQRRWMSEFTMALRHLNDANFSKLHCFFRPRRNLCWAKEKVIRRPSQPNLRQITNTSPKRFNQADSKREKKDRCTYLRMT